MSETGFAAKVIDASDRSYLNQVISILEQSRREIVLSLYLFEPADLTKTNHPVNRLAQALLDALGRKVRLRVFLNSNFRIRPKNQVGTGPWFETLLRSGLELTVLLPRRRLHDKLIVIDDRWVIEGSMNWSDAALTSNFESATIIDSPDLAKIKLERIRAFTQPAPARLPKPSVKKEGIPLVNIPASVLVPVILFEPNQLPAMIQTNAPERALDLYLILLGQAAGLGKQDFECDLETAGRALGLSDSWTRSQMRRQVIKVLKKLQDVYHLVRVDFAYAGSAHIFLSVFEGKQMALSGRFFEPSYLRQTSALQMMLEMLDEVLKMKGENIWDVTTKDLAHRYHFDPDALGRVRRALLPSQLQKGSDPLEKSR